MVDPRYDPRAVSNFILKARRLIGLETTQIEIQKLLFFSYEAYLIRRRAKLVKGYFEAWEYGPVHPDVYRAFKKYQGKPITEFATKTDPFTGEVTDIDDVFESSDRRHITEIVAKLSGLSAFELVELSHAPNGPWHSVVENAKSGVALGLRITDDAILGHRPHSMLMREGHHTISRGKILDDEAPLARDRSM